MRGAWRIPRRLGGIQGGIPTIHSQRLEARRHGPNPGYPKTLDSRTPPIHLPFGCGQVKFLPFSPLLFPMALTMGMRRTVRGASNTDPVVAYSGGRPQDVGSTGAVGADAPRHWASAD
jgi:hypothetical protein